VAKKNYVAKKFEKPWLRAMQNASVES